MSGPPETGRRRIVSLVPSVTESLLAWGVEPVAVTRFCEQPSLRHVGGTKDPDVAAIVALEPDLVVVNTEENRREDADSLVAAGLRVHVIEIDEIGDVPAAMSSLASAVGVEASDVEVPAGPRPDSVGFRAFIPIWRRPWMGIGGRCYGTSLLAHLGVRNIFDDADDRYPEVTLDEVADRAPDVVLVPSEPYAFREKHVTELATIAPVVRVDGQDLFWWGTRTPAAIDRLGRQLATVRT